jgi:putative resolvase
MRNGMYRPKEAADYLGVVDSTLRRYVMEGKIAPSAMTPGGMKLYSRESLDALLGVRAAPVEPVTVFYVRVSGHSNNVDDQVRKLEAAYGNPSRVYKDIASGLREGRPGLKRLLDDAEDHKYSRLCITANDRLTRFGYSYLERLLSVYGVTIMILDDATEKTPHDELMQDFMSLLASFSGKFYKLRSLKHEKMLLSAAGRKLAKRKDEREEA